MRPRKVVPNPKVWPPTIGNVFYRKKGYLKIPTEIKAGVIKFLSKPCAK